MNQTIKRLAAYVTAMAVLLSLSACGSKDKGEVIPPEGEYSSGGGYTPTVADVSPQLLEAVKKNTDVVGWLQVPNTKINEAVVQTKDNEYYLRRNAEKKYDYEGCYYLDYESVIFDDGTDFAQNSIIYGHNLGSPMGVKDDPEGVKFAQLLKLNDMETAQKTPYVYFTTESGPHIFEIFAVFYSEAVTDPVPYHYAEYADDKFNALVADVKSRSTFLYDVPVTAQDKILTLSTCSYKYGTYSQNPNQRFVLMARQVRAGEQYHERATIQVNENPKAPRF